MCLFTHFAAGALAGGATGHVGWAIPAGAASHALLDAIPHYDHPDWRIELAGGVAALVLLLLMPFASPAAVVGGLFGMAPDLENLFQKLGRLDRKRFIFPSHTGLIPHGRNLGPRSLVWQFVIFVACFGALGLISPTAAAAATDAAAIMERPTVEVLSASRNQTLLRVDFPVERQPVLWEGVPDRRIEWALAPEYLEEEDGTVRMLPPALTITLAVPTSQPPRTTIEQVSWWREPATALTDGQLASFSTPAVHRSVPLSGTRIPLAVGGGVLRSLTLRVEHPAQQGWSRDEILAEAAAQEQDLLPSGPAPSTVANPRVYRELSAVARGAGLARSARAVAKAAETDPFGLTSHWARFGIDETGVYRITGQELLVAGISSSAVHPSSLRLYRGGGLPLEADPTIPDSLQADRVGLNEVPIEVIGAGDGEWNLDDELRFYGVSTSVWLDRLVEGADPLEHYDHPMADEAVYWLTWESTATSPLPGTPLRVAGAAAAPTGGRALETARLRRHFEQQNFDDAGRVADNFVWFNSISSSWSSDFDLPGATADSSAFFVLDWRGMISDYRRSSSYRFAGTAQVNDRTDQSVTTDFSAWTQQDSLRVRLCGPFEPRIGASNRIVLENHSDLIVNVRENLATDSYDILYWAGLDLSAHPGQLEVPVWDGQTGTAAADLVVTGPSGRQPLVWDVTDPFSVRVLAGAVTGSHPDATTYGVDLSSGGHRIFQALTGDRLLDVGSIERTSPVALRGQSADVDYIVVHPGAFRTAALELADYRSTKLPDVESPVAMAVDVQDIYDNFSGGQKDWRAIRNYLRHVYETGGGRLKYVCLLGNACRDYRNQLGRTPQVDQFYDFVPTDVRTSYPNSPSWYWSQWPYASDDGLVSFDQAADGYLDAPDLTVGRLPAISAAEADAMVARTIAFDAEIPGGPWRNSVTLVADDQKYRNIDPYSGEWQHTKMAEDIATLLLPPTIDVERIYSLAYDFPPGGITKPDVKAAINTTLNRGTTIYHYIGHGSQDSLADERIFDDRDIPALTNGERLCMFSAFSCDVGMFDSSFRRSMGESFLASSQGGAIVTITASQVSFIRENNRLTIAFYQELFPERSADTTIGPGRALQQAKGRLISSGDQSNAQRYNLMGDPAIRLPHPVTDLAFAADTVDTLLTGRLGTVRIDGEASTVTPVAGDPYQLRVEEASTSHIFVSADADTYSYVLRGAPIFQGAGTAAGADVEASFMVPTQIRRGEDARVRVIVGDEDGGHAVQMRLPAVRSSSLPGTDLAGPDIDLAFADGLQRVRPGATLNATLSDPAGIATVGTSPITSILLEFDNSGFMSDLTESFAYEADSYTTGRIALALPAELETGDHTVAMYAADAFGNVGSDTLSFRIEDTISAGVESMALFPNPTSGPCRLVFELGEPMQLQWDIFTLSGKRVRTMRAGFDASGPASMGWDGRDDQGDEIANGTYLYVLRGRAESDPDHPFHKTGKLVLMK